MATETVEELRRDTDEAWAHWNDHAGQLAKIRAAAGLPAASSPPAEGRRAHD